MIIAARNRSDHKIHTLVRAELEWTPDLDAAGITVEVDDAVVTLSGEVGDYYELLAAGRAMRRIHGVSTVNNNLTVHPTSARWITDKDISRAADRVLTWSANVPRAVRATVESGRITLTGQVDWHFQSEAAERAVENIRGVRSVHNEISVIPRPAAADAAEKVRDAMFRNPQVDAAHVHVTVVGHTAVLTGHVRSLAQKKQAGAATWSSPDVSKVDNRLRVRVF